MVTLWALLAMLPPVLVVAVVRSTVLNLAAGLYCLVVVGIVYGPVGIGLAVVLVLVVPLTLLVLLRSVARLDRALKVEQIPVQPLPPTPAAAKPVSAPTKPPGRPVELQPIAALAQALAKAKGLM